MYNIPRKCQMDKWTPAEHAIYLAMQEVEKMGADVRLTDAVDLLGKAKDKVAEFVDDVPTIDNNPSLKDLLK